MTREKFVALSFKRSKMNRKNLEKLIKSICAKTKQKTEKNFSKTLLQVIRAF